MVSLPLALGILPSTSKLKYLALKKEKILLDLVDMHVHSYYSDGLYSPEALAQKAYRKALKGFALTDHDTVDGTKEAAQAAEKWGLMFIPGCEFSTYYPPIGELHVLTYFPTNNYEFIHSEMKHYQQLRFERVRKIVDKLKDYNLFIDFDRFINRTREEGKNSSIGRMHIARELVRNKYFKTPQQVFELYLGRGKKCFVEKEVPDTVEMMRRLSEHDVICAIAHPDFLKDENKWKHLCEFEKAGMNAVEYRHPRLSAGLSGKMEEKLSDRFYLLSGSDFHGDAKHKAIGKYGINIKKTKEMVNKFINRKK